MNLKKVLSVVVIAGAPFVVAPTKRAHALSLINPSPIAVEKMTTQVWWHRHHWRHHRRWGHRHHWRGW
jgi:hypothetical protein